jgi:DNA-binding NtrC family response regulator
MDFRILIVDDDRNLVSVLGSALADEAHHVVTCSNGLDAIQRCREKPFDLVITDIMMPGASGLDVIREVKKMAPETLVILITGFASLETAVSAIREGAYDYITKPFRLEEIRIVVKNALEKIQLLRENHRLLGELKEAYEQLHLVKTIMNEDRGNAYAGEMAEANRFARKTLIAGTVFPHHFVQEGVGDGSRTVSDLERLSHLKESGLISDREFQICKSKLLLNMK